MCNQLSYSHGGGPNTRVMKIDLAHDPGDRLTCGASIRELLFGANCDPTQNGFSVPVAFSPSEGPDIRAVLACLFCQTAILHSFFSLCPNWAESATESHAQLQPCYTR